MIWGLEPLAVPMPATFGAPINIFGTLFPSYYIAIIVSGLLTALMLWILLSLGRIMGIVDSCDLATRDMAKALGVNCRQRLYWLLVFALGNGLAAIAGVLARANRRLANMGSDMDAMVEAFAVLVVVRRTWQHLGFGDCCAP